jgi:hypothetical protein
MKWWTRNDDFVQQMTFENAMYNCLIRRMQLLALDDQDNSQGRDYWHRRFYYSNAIDTEILHYWTSGAPLVNETKMILTENTTVWCTNNKTSKSMCNFKFTNNNSDHNCVAFERWTTILRTVDCAKKLSFVCEASSKLNLKMCFNLFIISTRANVRCVRRMRIVQ